MLIHRSRVGAARLGAATLLAAAAVGLAGCTGSDPTPPTTSTLTTTTTSSPTPSSPSTAATATETGGIPAAAKAHTPAGAEAFARYFFSQLVLAWTRPDPSALASLCDADSKSCSAFQTTASDLTKDKQKYDRPPLEVTSIVYTGTDAGVVRMEMKGAQAASHIVNSSGGVVETLQREPSHLAIYARWSGSGWVVHDIKVVAE